MSNHTSTYSPCPQAPSPCVYYTYSHKKVISGGIFFIAPAAFMFTLLILLLLIQMRRLSNRQRQLAEARSYLQQEIPYPVDAPSNIGLTKEAIEAFPVKSFAVWKATLSDQASAENPQCPVCLCDYEDSEILRILPCHAFHSECIDSWLGSHTTCPICRTSYGPPDFELHNPTTSSWYNPTEPSSFNSIPPLPLSDAPYEPPHNSFEAVPTSGSEPNLPALGGHDNRDFVLVISPEAVVSPPEGSCAHSGCNVASVDASLTSHIGSVSSSNDSASRTADNKHCIVSFQPQ